MKFVLLLTLGVCASYCAPPMHPKDARPLVSEAQADSWTKSWQKRLGLGQWQISTQIVRVWELRPDTLGNVKWDLENHTASIKVLNPVDYELPAPEIPQDMEYTIVHELVHLQLAALPRDPSGRNTEERVVNQISGALFKLEKGDAYRLHPEAARSVPKAGAEASRSAH